LYSFFFINKIAAYIFLRRLNLSFEKRYSCHFSQARSSLLHTGGGRCLILFLISVIPFMTRKRTKSFPGPMSEQDTIFDCKRGLRVVIHGKVQEEVYPFSWKGDSYLAFVKRWRSGGGWESEVTVVKTVNADIRELGLVAHGVGMSGVPVLLVSPAAEADGVSDQGSPPAAEADGVSDQGSPPAAEADGVSDKPAAEAAGVSDKPAAEADGVSDKPAAEADGVSDQGSPPAAEADGVSDKPAAEAAGVSDQGCAHGRG
jgi:hypothetical protein